MYRVISIALTLLNIYLISYLPAWHFAYENLFFPLLIIGLITLYFIVSLVGAVISKNKKEIKWFTWSLAATLVGPVLLFWLLFSFQGYFQ